MYITDRVLLSRNLATAASRVTKESCHTIDCRDTLPTLLQYSFLSDTIEVGDVIEYKPRNDIAFGALDPVCLVCRATVTEIVEETTGTSIDDNAEPSKVIRVFLDNNTTIVDSLHLVRRISMQCWRTNKILWSPPRHWKELSSLYMTPSKVNQPPEIIHMDDNANQPSSEAAGDGADSNVNPPEEVDDTCDPAPEMRDPSKICIPALDNNKTKRKREQKKIKKAERKLDQPGTDATSSTLHWLSPTKLLTELRGLNMIYRRCMSFGDPESFRGLMSHKDKGDYNKEKKKLTNKLKKREGPLAWRPLTILMSLCFFTRIFQPSGGLVEPVNVEESQCEGQTNREMKRVEGALKFEHTNSLLSIRLCTTCLQNHLVESKKEPSPAETYECGKCKPRKNPNLYIKHRLLPIWYEREIGAKSHTEFKYDSAGEKIIRHDIPKELLSLTVAEQLLIRRCAPFMPTFHIGKGFYGIKGHCVAFAQDITEMAMTLPQRPESVVTFIRAMGNQETTDLKLKHLRVSRERVVTALKWLQLHHEGYHDVKIDETRLDWMKDQDTAIIKGNEKKLVFDDKNQPPTEDFVSKVQCAGDFTKEDVMDYSIFGSSAGDTVPTSGSDNINSLIDTSEKNHGKEKLMLFPPHSDKPIW